MPDSIPLADNLGVMLVEKPTAHIENWLFVPSLMGGAGHLMGEVSKHPRQEDFHAPLQMTSAVVYINEEEGVAETRNTRYTLGKKFE